MIEYGTLAHFLLGNGWHSLRTPQVTRKKNSDIGVPHWRVWTGRISSTLCILFIVIISTPFIFLIIGAKL